MAPRLGSAQFNDVFAISKIAACRAPAVARRHCSARLNEDAIASTMQFQARSGCLITEAEFNANCWLHRSCHNSGRDGLDDAISSSIFQVLFGWLDHRGRVQPRCWPHRSFHSSGRASPDYAIFNFDLDGLFIEAEFNADSSTLRSHSTKRR